MSILLAIWVICYWGPLYLDTCCQCAIDRLNIAELPIGCTGNFPGSVLPASSSMIYAFLQIKILLWMLHRIDMEGITMMLAAKKWPRWAWCSDILKFLVDTPMSFPRCPHFLCQVQYSILFPGFDSLTVEAQGLRFIQVFFYATLCSEVNFLKGVLLDLKSLLAWCEQRKLHHQLCFVRCILFFSPTRFRSAFDHKHHQGADLYLGYTISAAAGLFIAGEGPCTGGLYLQTPPDAFLLAYQGHSLDYFYMHVFFFLVTIASAM